jgi:hypothetical protein
MENRRNFTTQKLGLTHKKTEHYEVIGALLLPLIGMSISFLYHYLGAAFVILGLWVFIKKFLGRSTIISRFFPEDTLYTELLTFNKRSKAKQNTLLLLPKQFYQSGAGDTLDRFFHGYFYIYTFSTVAAVFWLYSKSFINNSQIFLPGTIVLFVIQAGFIFTYFFVHFKLKHKPLALTEKIISHFDTADDLENLYILIKPDCCSIDYIEDFIDRYRRQLHPDNTVVVNLSPACSAVTSGILEEGVIVIHEYSEFTSLLQKLNMPVVANKTYMSDLLPFIHHEFSGFSITCAGENRAVEDIYAIMEELQIRITRPEI